MIDRYQNIARAFLAVLWLAMGGAAAQVEQPSLTTGCGFLFGQIGKVG